MRDLYFKENLFVRIIDVGSEWRTFRNDSKSGEDPSRVGGPENPLLNGSDLSTVVGPCTGAASFDESGFAKYHTRKSVRTKSLNYRE